MDLKELKKKALEGIRKHKYALVILAVGLLLMLLPAGLESDSEEETATPVTQEKGVDVAKELAAILSRIEGAGEVEVLLTVASGEVTVYQEDTDISGDGSSVRYDTVIVRDAGGAETGLIQQINPPKYQGAIIVCRGADRPAVKLAIVEAVSKVTGLGADQISVLKMK